MEWQQNKWSKQVYVPAGTRSYNLHYLYQGVLYVKTQLHKTSDKSTHIA